MYVPLHGRSHPRLTAQGAKSTNTSRSSHPSSSRCSSLNSAPSSAGRPPTPKP
jgi:hypothetical protein